MRADENGFALLGEEGEEFAQFHPRAGIQSGGGLVEDEYLRIGHQRAPEADALFHSFGKRAQSFLADGVDVGKFLHAGHGFGALSAAQSVGAREKIKVLVHGGVPIRLQFIGHKTDDLARLFRILHHREIVHKHITGVGLIERGHNAHGGGFTRAIGADEGVDLAGLKLKGNGVYRDCFAKLTPQILHTNFHGPASDFVSTPSTTACVLSCPRPMGFSIKGESSSRAR